MLSVMTNCAEEFNTEPDVLKYQIVVSDVQRIKIGFWDRRDRQLLLTGWAEQRSLRRCDTMVRSEWYDG